MTDLLPCPFCGSRALMRLYGYRHWIQCADCVAQSGDELTEADAVAKWNSRHGMVGRDAGDTELVRDALERHRHYLVRRVDRPSAKPDGADAHALARLHGLQAHLGFVNR